MWTLPHPGTKAATVAALQGGVHIPKRRSIGAYKLTATTGYRLARVLNDTLGR
jgi:hypothetical protein